MQLPNFHSYSAKTLQKQLQSGMYPNLRWFQMIGGHQYEEVGKQGAYAPVWTRQTGVPVTYQCVHHPAMPIVVYSECSTL